MAARASMQLSSRRFAPAGRPRRPQVSAPFMRSMRTRPGVGRHASLWLGRRARRVVLEAIETSRDSGRRVCYAPRVQTWRPCGSERRLARVLCSHGVRKNHGSRLLSCGSSIWSATARQWSGAPPALLPIGMVPALSFPEAATQTGTNVRLTSLGLNTLVEEPCCIGQLFFSSSR